MCFDVRGVCHACVSTVVKTATKKGHPVVVVWLMGAVAVKDETKQINLNRM